MTHDARRVVVVEDSSVDEADRRASEATPRERDALESLRASD